MKKVTVFFFVMFSFLPFFTANGFAESHERDSWYIGFGLGTGIDAKYTIKDGPTVNFDDQFAGAETKSPKLAFNFKIGKTLSPNTLLGLDVTAVGQTATHAGTAEQVQINNYFLMLTYFPSGEGLLFRLGGGLSGLVLKGFGTDQTYGGYGVLGGVGYALWLGKNFNLTFNADYSTQKYSGSSLQPDSSQFLTAYIGFDWY